MAVAAIPEETVRQVQQQLRGLAQQLMASTGPQAPSDRAMAEAVTGFLDRIEGRGSQPAVNGIIALPLLVHGVRTGDPLPAVPAAMAHVLWWVSARYLDDLSDGGPVPDSGSDKYLLAVIDLACHLSAEVLDAAGAGNPAQALRLRQELSRCWHSAIAGQLTDLTADPATAAPDEVLASYRGKTGAPYAMSAAMGAVLAGCDAHSVTAWREFGESFGVLRQLVNDQRDLASGRYEDLRNATGTYMTVHYLRSLSPQERAMAERLLAECAHSPAAREQFAARLTEPTRLRDFADTIRPLIEDLHTSVDSLAGAPLFTAGLHDLVEETVDLFPQFLLSPAPQP